MSQLALDLTHASHTLPQPLQGHPYLDINDAQQSQTADNMSLPSITTQPEWDTFHGGQLMAQPSLFDATSANKHQKP